MSALLRRRTPAALALAAALLLPAAARAAVPVPGAPQARPIAVVGATIHTVSGADIAGGTVVFDRGRITALGADAAVPADAERVDGRGLHVYPGLIDPYSILGLSEIEAVRATNDYAETGDITPNVRAEVAFQSESDAIPVTRANGVLLAVAAPRGTLLRGSAALMALDGWNWTDMTMRAPIGLCVSWPGAGARGDFWRVTVPEEVRKQAHDRQVQKLEQAFADAEAYRRARTAHGKAGAAAHATDERWEAMLPVIEGKLPLIVEADELAQIEEAVAFADQHHVRLVLYGGYDAPRCADLLRSRGVPVIVRATMRLPLRRSDPYDEPLCTPEKLRRAGVPFCIANGGGAANERNLPYQAAGAMSCGLPREEALRAVTLYPARILGVADRVGSLEVGKDATLILTDGDPLETATQVKAAFIEGRRVELADKQKVLWQKYEEKHRREAAAARTGAAAQPGAATQPGAMSQPAAAPSGAAAAGGATAP